MDYTHEYYKEQSPFPLEDDIIYPYDEFSGYPIRESSPHGGFIVKRISKRILVCECTRDDHPIARGWDDPVDHIRRFITYVGYNESDTLEWLAWVNRVKLSASRYHERRAKRVGTKWEVKAYGLSAGYVRSLAIIDET